MKKYTGEKQETSSLNTKNKPVTLRNERNIRDLPEDAISKLADRESSIHELKPSSEKDGRPIFCNLVVRKSRSAGLRMNGLHFDRETRRGKKSTA